MSVLVADDQHFNLHVMSLQLSKINSSWSVTRCTTAEDAVSAAQQSKFHLIIMDEDFGPDKMTGSKAIQLIRANELNIDSVIVSWTAGELLGPPPGADFIWSKGANAAKMQAAINQALASMQKLMP